MNASTNRGCQDITSSPWCGPNAAPAPSSASATVLADATQTLLCAYLSAALLVGLLDNATLGWAWADSLAALIIAATAAHEGWEAWHGEHTPSPLAAPATSGADTD